jgi:hypothetical protein
LKPVDDQVAGVPISKSKDPSNDVIPGIASVSTFGRVRYPLRAHVETATLGTAIETPLIE